MLYDFQTNPIGIIFFTREKKNTSFKWNIIYKGIMCSMNLRIKVNRPIAKQRKFWPHFYDSFLH